MAWFAFVPFFFALEKEKPFNRFLISYAAGVLFFLGTIYWLIHVTFPGMIVVVLYLALYFGLFGLFSNFKFQISNYPLPITHYPLLYLPALWVTLEWIRSRLFTGFGWALLAHSQGYNLPIIQIADVTGAYGVSFLIIAVNVALFLTIKNYRKKKYSLVNIYIATFLVFAALYYGYYRLNNIFTGEKIRVAVVQGNIPQLKKWDARFREEILGRYEALTKEAAKDDVDLIVWPETSVPGFMETERGLRDRITGLARSGGKPLFVGAPREEAKGGGGYFNSAMLFSEDGRMIGSYDKLHLVPFGEYIPWEKAFSFVQRFSTMPIGDFENGTDWTVFNFTVERDVLDKDRAWRLLKKVKFSCLICFEDIFPEISREFVGKGAGFLVNITNDAWFGKTSAAYQHAQSSVFRAVENRVNVVRAANTGLSCFIDQKGAVTGAVNVNGESLFVEGLASRDIVLTKTRTFYNVYGDVFVYLCMALTALSVIISIKPWEAV